MVRTTNGFNSLKLADFIQKNNLICGKMTGNKNFPNQQASVTELCADRDEFATLVTSATGGATVAILERDAKRASITLKLQVLGSEVSAVAKGDISILESSGFSFTKSKQPSPDIVQPDAPKVSLGINKGEILCTAKKQVGNERVMYMISTNPDIDNNWTSYSSSLSSYLFDKLVSGQRYYIKYALQGVRNQEVESDIVSYIPQ